MLGTETRHPEQIIEEWYFVGKLALVILVAVTILFWWKGEEIINGGNGCVFLKVVGFYCPGCGGTRAFHYWAHGQWWKSILCNPFVVYTMVGYTLFMGNTFLYKHTNKIGFEKFPVMTLIYIGVGIMFGQWILRNVLYLGFGLTVL